MRKTKIFKEPNSYEKMTEWAEKNKDKYEMDIIFVENGYGVEYKPFLTILKDKEEFETQVEIDKLDEAINIFEEKIRKQGMITNARDEEQLARLKELRSQYEEKLAKIKGY